MVAPAGSPVLSSSAISFFVAVLSILT